MQLTPEDIQKLETKQIANVIRKLNAGKTLTARDEALLSRAKAAPPAAVQTSEPQPAAAPPPILSGFAKTWGELAEILSVDRRTLTNLRQKYGKACPKDQADGRKEIAPWAAFLGEKGVQGRGLNNPDTDFLDERKLRLEERKLRVDRERYELNRAQDELAPLTHFEAALGTALAAFHQALDGLPDRIAGGLAEADLDELLKLLKRAEKDKLPYKTLRGMLEKGKARAFADFHARAAFIESEIDALRRILVQCEYIQADEHGDEDA